MRSPSSRVLAAVGAVGRRRGRGAFATAVTALALVLAGGCAEGDAPDSGPPSGEEAARGSPASTTGTLRLGEETYEFDVIRCYLEGEDNNESTSTLRGRGTLPDGTEFEVLVDRTTSGAWLHQSVRMDVGRLGRPGSTTWEARRSRSEGSWTTFLSGVGEIPDEPLVEIEGNALRARGSFEQTDGPEEDRVVEGALEATCPG